MASELDDFDQFDPMTEDYIKSLNDNYFGASGFASPNSNVVTSKEPINILVDKIPDGLTRDGLVRVFKQSGVLPINCKLFRVGNFHKAIIIVKTITEATTAIQSLNQRPPLKLKLTLASSKEDFFRKKEEIENRQRAEIIRHFSAFTKPLTEMGEMVTNLCAVEHLFKILPGRDDECFACTTEPLIRHVHFIASDEIVLDPFEGLPDSTPVSCAYCSTKEGKFVFCSKCKAVVYCGLRCQSIAWPHHRDECSLHQTPIDKISTKQQKSPQPQPNLNQKMDQKPKLDQQPKADLQPKPQLKPNPDQKPKLDQQPKADLQPKPQPQPNPDQKPKLDQQPKPRQQPKSDEQAKPIIPKQKDKLIDDSSLNDSKYPKDEELPKESKETNGQKKTWELLEPPKDGKNRHLPRPKISLNEEVHSIEEIKLEYFSELDIMVSFCNTPSEFYIQRFDDGPMSIKLMNDLDEAYESSEFWPGARKLKPGYYCAALFTDDNSWYRVKVIEMREREAYVHFIDFGNNEIVSFDDLRPLQPVFTTIPALAVRCGLKSLKPLFESGWHQDASIFFESLFESELVYNHCKVSTKVDDTYQVELFNNQGVTVNTLMVQKGFAKHYEEIRKPLNLNRRLFGRRTVEPQIISNSVKHPEPRIIAENENENEKEIERIRDERSFRPVEVSPPRPKEILSPPRPRKILSPSEALELSRKVSPANFYHLYKMAVPKKSDSVLLYMDPEDESIVYTIGDDSAVMKLISGLDSIDKKASRISPKPGVFGAATADDGEKYRILVLENLPGDKIRVFYPDFGNQDEIDGTEVYVLPRAISMENLPAQAIRCRVDNANSIPNYSEAVEKRIEDGTSAGITVNRKISEHEYGIDLDLDAKPKDP